MKTVVITGASRGIGLATAATFLAEGWRVVGTYVTTPIPIKDKNLISFRYDQGDPKSIAAFSKKVKGKIATIDALVNNAGILIDGKDKTADPAAVRKTLEVNVVGVIDVTERLLPLMKKGSQIVNLSSGYGTLSRPIDDASCAGYRISKAAINMYTKHLAFRLKPKGIIVSSIRPGWVKTHMGYSIATERDKPSRTPELAARDIFKLVTTVKETGQFWQDGKKQTW